MFVFGIYFSASFTIMKQEKNAEGLNHRSHDVLWHFSLCDNYRKMMKCIWTRPTLSAKQLVNVVFFLHSREDTVLGNLITRVHFPLMLLWRITLRMSCAHFSRRTAGLKLCFELSLSLMNLERQITPRSDPLIQKVQNVSFSDMTDVMNSEQKAKAFLWIWFMTIYPSCPIFFLTCDNKKVQELEHNREQWWTLRPRTEVNVCICVKHYSVSKASHSYRQDKASSGGNQFDFRVHFHPHVTGVTPKDLQYKAHSH